MSTSSRFNCIFAAIATAFAALNLQAQNTELNIERSVKVEFNSQKGYSYDVYGTSDPARKTGWKLLGGEEGTGENIVFFYRSDSDQKVFFRVDAKPSKEARTHSRHSLRQVLSPSRVFLPPNQVAPTI